MAVIETHPASVAGPWSEGFVLDKHMVWSVPVGHDGVRTVFKSQRTPLGELVYRFKNRGGSPVDIIDTAADFVARRWPSGIDMVVWPPPSIRRARQPAAILARGIAERIGAPIEGRAVKKVAVTQQIKNLATYERAAVLEEAIQPGPVSLENRRILIVDDLWQTGSTMRRVASVLRSAGAADVRALAMTRTR